MGKKNKRVFPREISLRKIRGTKPMKRKKANGVPRQGPPGGGGVNFNFYWAFLPLRLKCSFLQKPLRLSQQVNGGKKFKKNFPGNIFPSEEKNKWGGGFPSNFLGLGGLLGVYFF